MGLIEKYGCHQIIFRDSYHNLPIFDQNLVISKLIWEFEGIFNTIYCGNANIFLNVLKKR